MVRCPKAELTWRVARKFMLRQKTSKLGYFHPMTNWMLCTQFAVCTTNEPATCPLTEWAAWKGKLKCKAEAAQGTCSWTWRLSPFSLQDCHSPYSSHVLLLIFSLQQKTWNDHNASTENYSYSRWDITFSILKSFQIMAVTFKAKLMLTAKTTFRAYNDQKLTAQCKAYLPNLFQKQASQNYYLNSF